MLDSAMIDVALGLISFFLVMSLSVTAVQGWLSSILKLRGKNLRKGIENLTDHKIAEKIYTHPLMKTMGSNPSYLKSKYFAQILIDIIDKKAPLNEKSNVKALIDKIENEDLKKIFQILNIKPNDKIEELEKKISDWFDTGMERVSGWYQRKMQTISIIISAFLVIIINADALNIAQALFQEDALRAKTSAIVDQISKENSELTEANKEQNTLLQNLENQLKITDFPIGWRNENWNKYKSEFNKEECTMNMLICIWFIILKLFGWLITISAVSLGAPFWFDLIGKVANIRNSIKPKEKEIKNV